MHRVDRTALPGRGFLHRWVNAGGIAEATQPSRGEDCAAALLSGLKEIAAGAKGANAFARRVAELAARHGQKRQFMARLTKSGSSTTGTRP